MKALSIRQPWAWLIIHGGKDVENRTWHTKHRGRFLVHARAEYCEALELVMRAAHIDVLRGFPMFEDLQRGGIIGSVELVDSLDTSDSPWYMGEKAFALRNPEPLPFMPFKGRLNFFEVPDELMAP
jgi:hypothetical protein